MLILNRRFVLAVLGWAIGIFAPAGALAHHGSIVNPELYRAENLVELEGEVTAIFWRNPHPRFKLSVVNESKEETIWELEMNGSINGYRRMGIGATDIVQVGDQIKVAGFISKIETASLGVLHMLLTNGREFVNGRNRELRWSTQRMAGEFQDLDVSTVEAAKQSADGVFRVWANVQEPGIKPAEYEPFFTDKGRQLAAAYDPLKDNYELDCTQGMPETMFDRGSPMEIVNQGERILIHLQEYDVERVIHMNAQNTQMEKELSPLGYSEGKWEGNTLVVNTTGVSWAYYDEVGIPQSEQVSYSERFSASDDGNLLSYQITINDPVVFTKPYVRESSRKWEPGRQVELFNCTPQWEGVEGIATQFKK
ncbi:MAG: DUF6152 family protein [Arenicellaceae bacterium]|nr:DUF6152 family protein [Arenicellaceae bacterium]